MNALINTNNLGDLSDAAEARGNLDVYSKEEVNNRVGYTLLPVSSPALNSRTVIGNPFGNETPVICIPEIFHATLQKWVAISWIYSGSSESTGLVAWYSEGEGIVLNTGNRAFLRNSSWTGCSQPISSDYTTLSPVRINVFKVTS